MTEPNLIWIASFDIGKVNFAFSIEEVDLNLFSNIPSIPKYNRYNPNGTCTPEFLKIIQQVQKIGRIILVNNVNLTEGCDKTNYLDKTLFHNMIDYLDKFKKILHETI